MPILKNWLPRNVELENNPTWLPVVAAALFDREGRVLMQKRPLDKHHGGLWEFPGGKVESDETPENALVREIAEELAIELPAETLEPAGFAQRAGEGTVPPIVILLYTVREWQGSPRPCHEAEIGWFTAPEAQELAKPPLDIALLSGLIRSGAF